MMTQPDLLSALAEARAKRSEQLDELIEVHLKLAKSDDVDCDKSAHVVIKAIEQIAKLNGLHQAPKQQIDVSLSGTVTLDDLAEARKAAEENEK